MMKTWPELADLATKELMNEMGYEVYINLPYIEKHNALDERIEEIKQR